MSDPVFVNGLIVKKAPEGAPDFVKCKLSFKVEDMVAFLNEHNNEGWVNAEIKSSKKGGLYAQLDTWKKKLEEQPAPAEQSQDPDDLPF
jgi:hypothetical protein